MFALMSRRFGWIRPEPLIAVVLWGGIYPGAKLALDELPVLTFTVLRVVLGAALLLLLAARSGPWLPPASCRTALLNAGLAQTCFQITLIAALDRTTAANAAVLLATSPLLVVLWVAVTGRRLPGMHRWAALAAGMIGIALVTGAGSGGLAASNRLGDLAALASGAAWAWYGLAIGPLVKAAGAPRATAWTLTITAALLLPLAGPELLAQSYGDLTWRAWAGVLYGAVGGLVLAMALWGRSVARHGAGPTMVYAYLEPVSAVLLAGLILGESLEPAQAAGAALALLGVWLTR